MYGLPVINSGVSVEVELWLGYRPVVVVCRAPMASSGFFVVYFGVRPKMIGAGTEVDSCGVRLTSEPYGVVDNLVDNAQWRLADLYRAVCERS